MDRYSVIGNILMIKISPKEIFCFRCSDAKNILKGANDPKYPKFTAEDMFEMMDFTEQCNEYDDRKSVGIVDKNDNAQCLNYESAFNIIDKNEYKNYDNKNFDAFIDYMIDDLQAVPVKNDKNDDDDENRYFDEFSNDIQAGDIEKVTVLKNTMLYRFGPLTPNNCPDTGKRGIYFSMNIAQALLMSLEYDTPGVFSAIRLDENMICQTGKYSFRTNRYFDRRGKLIPNMKVLPAENINHIDITLALDERFENDPFIEVFFNRVPRHTVVKQFEIDPKFVESLLEKTKLSPYNSDYKYLLE